MTAPTHSAIAARAYEIWQDDGEPSHRDTTNRLEAERQLTAILADAQSNSAAAHLAATVFFESHHAFVQAERIALQKHDARAPKIPHHTGPHAKPVESGKPLWNQAHSS